jgi:hypothetical protein
MWSDIHIKSVKPYRSYPRLKKDDRVTVTVDMPIEAYSGFRRQIEAPHALRNRRSTDTKKGTPHVSEVIPETGV